ncbi:DNA damage-inducible protein 1 [Diaporthe eres]|uniref:DNA damage-inducible protein 1 n=1 Tax=Diaporthe eres TaxID=83184 RepID=A0ABR1PKB6_DIAER
MNLQCTPTAAHKRITLSINNPEAEDQDLLSLDIFPDMTLETLRSSIHAETRIEPNAQHLYHNGQLISDNSKTMEQLQIADGEMLALHVRDMRGSTGVPATREQQPRRAPTEQDPELIRLQLLGSPPEYREELRRTQPQLAQALDDPARFASAFRDVYDRERRERADRQRQIAALNADPFDIEAQEKIAEIIRQEQVMENLQNAMEHNPEVFGRVHMLYVDIEVNGHKVKALVDSGAQATIMSPQCAEACNIMRLVDKRFAGIAKGVGTATIVGRVHSAQIKIGSLFLPCSFTVMEGKNVELLLGLDMLKRHQASIDLAKDKLIIQGVEIPFLGEAEIPKDFEEALEEEPTVKGPGGTTIGGRSGAISQPGSSSGAPGPSSSAPAPAATPSAAPAPAPAASGESRFPDESIERLVQLGFPRDAAIRALEATGGNLDFAASLLFQS